MIKQLVTLIFLWTPILILSQTYYEGDTVFVESCNNCLLDNATYNDSMPVAFHTRNIISDFGPRDLSGGFWHGGVDYTVEDSEDHGYHIRAIESGTLQRWRGNSGQKYPEIIGESMHLMYNHCFTSASVSNSNALREGDIELVQLDNNNLGDIHKWGMIHYHDNDTTLIAACPNGDCSNSFKLINLDTTG